MKYEFYYHFDTNEHSLFDIRFDYGNIVETEVGRFTGYTHKSADLNIDLFRVRFSFYMVWNRKDIGYEEAYKQYHGKYPRKTRRHTT